MRTLEKCAASMKWTSIGPLAQIRSTAGGSAPIQIVPGTKGGTAMPCASGRKAPVFSRLAAVLRFVREETR